MPDIDLRPDDYRKQNRWGRWYTPDDPRVAAILLVLSLLVLVYLFLVRDQLTSEVLYGAAAIFGAGAGGSIVLLMKALNIN